MSNKVLKKAVITFINISLILLFLILLFDIVMDRNWHFYTPPDNLSLSSPMFISWMMRWLGGILSTIPSLSLVILVLSKRLRIDSLSSMLKIFALLLLQVILLVIDIVLNLLS